MAKKVQDLTTGKTEGTTSSVKNMDQPTEEQKKAADQAIEKANYPNRTTANKLKKTATDQTQLQKQFDKRQKEMTNGINSAMNATQKSQKQSLKDAYNENRDAWKQQRTDTKADYTAVSKDVLQQTKQNGAGLNAFANVNGVNTGGGSQQSLQLNQVRSTARGNVQAQRMRALEENARQQALAKTDYQNRVQQAIKNHDYTRAAALLDDYNNQNAWRENQAKLLAGYGNFDAYGMMYGADQATNMRNMWIITNPELAYNTGAIDANRYKEITGQDAPDVVAQGGGGGGGVVNDPFYYINGRPVPYANTSTSSVRPGGGDS